MTWLMLKPNVIGNIKCHLVNQKTNKIIKFCEHSNIIAYSAADIMAKIVSGETAYIPKYIGFIYGPNSVPGAALVDPPTSRVQTWSNIASELADPGVHGNVLITPLSAVPAISVNGNGSYYNGNCVTVSAQTGARLEYGFPTTGSVYEDELSTGDYIYQVVLLTRLVSENKIEYIPFARATVKDSSYPQKLDEFDFSIYWSISFF